MKTFMAALAISFSVVVSALTAKAEPLDPKFFANAAFQARFPGAYALQSESLGFVETSLRKTFSDGDALIAAIEKDSALHREILNFAKLDYARKVQVLKRVFGLEVAASGYAAPELILDDSAKRSTFFDFDPKTPGPGRVILNPKELFAEANSYEALLFLIHETRHSFQFQLAYDGKISKRAKATKAFQRGFVAQKQIFEQGLKASFCDFLTLNQEYEAFLFGNYVMEMLTAGAVDTSGMGTFASQFEPGLGLKLNLIELAKKVGPLKLLDAFNELEKAQYSGN